MKMVKKFRLDSDRRWFTILLLSLLFVGVIECVVFFQIRSGIFERNLKEFRNRHEQNKVLFRDLADQAETAYNRLVIDEGMVNLLQSPSSQIDYYALREVQRSFINLMNTNPNIVSIYFHDKRNDLVMSTKFSMSRLDSFINRDLFYELYQKKNKTRHWQTSRNEVAGQAASPRTIALEAYLPRYSQKAAIVFNFDEKKILHSANTSGLVVLNEDNEIIVADSSLTPFFVNYKDQILAGFSDKFLIQIDGQYLQLSMQEGTSFKILSFLPAAQAYSGAQTYWFFIVLIASLLLIFCLFKFLKITYVKPLEVYRVSMQQSMEDLRQNLFNQMITTSISTDVIKSKLRELGMSINSDCFQVILFQIDDYYNYLLKMEHPERYLKNKIVFNSIKWTFSLQHRALTIKTAPEKIAVLLPLERLCGDDEMLTENSIRYIQKEILDNYNLTVCVGISDIVCGIENVNICYANALRALEFKAIYGKHSIIRFSDINKHGDAARYYPIAQLNQIIDFINKGDVKQAESALDNTLQEILDNADFSIELLNSFTSNVLYSVVKLIIENHFSIKDIFDEDIFIILFNYETVKEKRDFLVVLIRRFEDYKSEKIGAAYHSRTVDAIMDYILANYDRAISLRMVADALDMSPTYISTLFKNKFGSGFLDYVNELRIKKSITLLQETTLTISKISEACGYISVHSFIRNFKKHYLVTPNDFRNRLSG